MDTAPYHQARLSVAARVDITWRYTFVGHWNGLSLIWNSAFVFPNRILVLNASGSWGVGHSAPPTGLIWNAL